MAKTKKKKRADHYDPKLQINGTFEDVIKVSMTVPPMQAKPQTKKKKK